MQIQSGWEKTKMGAPGNASVAENFEPFSVPEYFMTHIGATEIIPGSECVRMYCGTTRGGHFRAEFTVVVPIAMMGGLARQALEAAADGHNALAFAH